MRCEAEAITLQVNPEYVPEPALNVTMQPDCRAADWLETDAVRLASVLRSLRRWRLQHVPHVPVSVAKAILIWVLEGAGKPVRVSELYALSWHSRPHLAAGVAEFQRAGLLQRVSVADGRVVVMEATGKLESAAAGLLVAIENA